MHDGDNPGVFSDEIPQDLVRGLMNCWNRNPLLRPNAMSLTMLLQEAWVRNLPSISQPTMPPPPPPSQVAEARSLIKQSVGIDNYSLSLAKQEALSLIGRARDKPRPTGNSNDNAATEKLPLQCLQKVIGGIRGCDAECFFIIGASVWWKLLDADTYPLVATLEVPSREMVANADCRSLGFGSSIP